MTRVLVYNEQPNSFLYHRIADEFHFGPCMLYNCKNKVDKLMLFWYCGELTN